MAFQQQLAVKRSEGKECNVKQLEQVAILACMCMEMCVCVG